MKATHFTYHIILPLALLLLVTACQRNKEQLVQVPKDGLYFVNDSMYYSFGVTPLSVNAHVVEIPVRVMGSVTKKERSFKVSIDAATTTAVEGVHFTIDQQQVIATDSGNGVLKVNILREPLEDDDFRLGLRIIASGDFEVMNQPNDRMVLEFNNRVERPTWKDFSGRPTWPTSKLGQWNPITYIKFIELFRELETKAPAAYASMVQQFGEDLANVTFGWPWDFDYTMKKYVLIPMYAFFQAHPELGVTMPNPN